MVAHPRPSYASACFAHLGWVSPRSTWGHNAGRPAPPRLGRPHVIARWHYEAATRNRVGPAILAVVTVLSLPL